MVQRTNFKVLVADDHFTARQTVTTVLQQHNITNIVAVADGKEAIEAIEAAYRSRSPFQIIFLDWDMPHVTGLQVLAHFRQNKAHDNTAFVMLTAAAQQSEIMQAIKAGATSYIVKPVSRAKIGEKVTEICNWVRKTEAKAEKEKNA